MTNREQSWSDPPLKPALTADEVHVWQIVLNRPIDEVEELQTLLASEEISRADRFRFERDRRRFVVVHGLLRVILGRYLGLKPSQLRFVYSDYGKPALAPAPATRGLSFNLSHTHELALVAVTRDRQLGIDLEHIRHIPEVEQIAERFFSPQENEIIQALTGSERLEAFFQCWTCKEAYIKARGEGLSLPLDQFQVVPILGEAVPFLSVKGDPQESSRWSLRKLIPAPGYVAALAVEGKGWRLAQWRYFHSASMKTAKA
jgi:4'-phosphopantetheinyl transferase